jgi:dipeptidyl aminopeptidase/acylaminoacyl peptidase
MASSQLVRRSLLLLLAALGIIAHANAQVRHDTFIHLTTGDSLDATYFTPPQSVPPKGFPGIIFVHGFGADKYATLASCSLYADGGYTTLCFSVRGHGLSSGNSTIMATRERADFAEVVAWFRLLPNIDTAAIGVTGGSQGGLHGLWSAANRLPVAAVTSDVIVPQWASDMLANGTIRRTAILSHATNSVRYDTRAPASGIL